MLTRDSERILIQPAHMDIYNIYGQKIRTLPRLKMGLDPERFEGEVDEELLCPICSEVLDEPLQVRNYTSLR